MDTDYAKIGDKDGGRYTEFEHSLFVLATVMSTPDADRAIVDAGLKSYSGEKGPPWVHGREDIELTNISDEHGKLEDRAEGEAPEARRKGLAHPGALRPDRQSARLVCRRAGRPRRGAVADQRARGEYLRREGAGQCEPTSQRREGDMNDMVDDGKRGFLKQAALFGAASGAVGTAMAPARRSRKCWRPACARTRCWRNAARRACCASATRRPGPWFYKDAKTGELERHLQGRGRAAGEGNPGQGRLEGSHFRELRRSRCAAATTTCSARR